MKFTNRYNLPEHFCRWLESDDYDYQPGVISTTTLLKPARAWALMQRHRDELVMDYSDLIAIRYGSALHDSLEKASAFGGNVVEQRFFAEVSGRTISGKFDAIIDGVIWDNKSTSVWKFVNGEFDDYVKQLSIYKFILAQNGITVADFGMIAFLFTDWKKSDALKGGSYPPLRLQTKRIELMTLDETREFIDGRVMEFGFALSVLPECTPEELWAQPERFAVYKTAKALRATRVYENRQEADKLAAEIGGVVQHRPGKMKRCGYCQAAPFCEQCQKMREAGLIDEP